MPDSEWRNRIVRSAEVDPCSIPDHPHNWRTHPPAQVAALDGVLAEVGLVARCLVNLRSDASFEEEQGTPVLLDGHLRKERAIASNQAKVPVDYVDLTKKEELLILVTLDPLAERAEPDPVELDLVLRQVETDSDAVQRMVEDVASEAGLDMAIFGWADVAAGAEAPQSVVEEKASDTMVLSCGEIRETIPMVLYLDFLNAFLEEGDLAEVLRVGVAKWGQSEG